MKIDGLPFINKDVVSADKRRENSAVGGDAPKSEQVVKGDVVNLSDRSRMIARAQELATRAPEVRQGLVNDLRTRINSGTYNVSGQAVADSMLKKSITEV